MGPVVSHLGRRGRVLLLDDDTRFADAVNRSLYSSAELVLSGHTADPDELRLLLNQYGPDVLLVDESLPSESGLAIAERVVKDYKDVWVILITDSPSRQLVNDAMSRGIRRVVSRPRDLGPVAVDHWAGNVLVAAVASVIQEEKQQMELLMASGPDEEGPAVTPLGGRIVTVWGPKGGTGKSTIATNLALYAQTNPVQRIQTALVGMDSGSGTINALLAMEPKPTIMDWLDYAGETELDPDAIMKRIERHESGLYVVFEPELKDLNKLSADLAKTVIGSLHKAAETGLVVVDTEPSLLSTEGVGTALDMAHIVLIVVEPTMPCLQRTKDVVGTIVKNEMLDPTKLRLVINRQAGRPDITAEEIVDMLQIQCVGIIPEDPAVRSATNTGRPLAIYAPDGPFMRGLKQVAAKIVPALGSAAADQRASGRRKLLGLF